MINKEFQGYKEFEFDLPEALLERLLARLDEMGAAILKQCNLSMLPDAQGVYQLLHANDIVYIGKTDAEAGLKKRLDRHFAKVQHRHNLDPSTLCFKAVRIFVFTAMDLETQLIRHYKGPGCQLWNGSGFGANDPGRERETTNKAPDGYDARYPINIDLPEALLPEGQYKVSDALKKLKVNLPYVLRYRKAHPDLMACVTIPPAPQTTRQLMHLIVSSLPDGWQATAFVSHVILYKEEREYVHGTKL
ncbi:MAG: GIY-YIG nuclease family protein [Candidatus Binatia bacterium]